MRGDKGTAGKHAAIIVAALQCPVLLSVIVLCSALTVSGEQAFDWVPSDKDIQRYRQSWNPLARTWERKVIFCWHRRILA